MIGLCTIILGPEGMDRQPILALTHEDFHRLDNGDVIAINLEPFGGNGHLHLMGGNDENQIIERFKQQYPEAGIIDARDNPPHSPPELPSA